MTAEVDFLLMPGSCLAGHGLWVRTVPGCTMLGMEVTMDGKEPHTAGAAALAHVPWQRPHLGVRQAGNCRLAWAPRMDSIWKLWGWGTYGSKEVNQSPRPFWTSFLPSLLVWGNSGLDRALGRGEPKITENVAWMGVIMVPRETRPCSWSCTSRCVGRAVTYQEQVYPLRCKAVPSICNASSPREQFGGRTLSLCGHCCRFQGVGWVRSPWGLSTTLPGMAAVPMVHARVHPAPKGAT